ncbi:MAG: hypothetical protein DRN95_04700 [Candidatus Hydrothermarchaeota archaeon]|nr:MAG: hypothetical protein DRN95_04700 [Candidatus Hydrothermarchaeota archaeon]
MPEKCDELVRRLHEALRERREAQERGRKEASKLLLVVAERLPLWEITRLIERGLAEGTYEVRNAKQVCRGGRCMDIIKFFDAVDDWYDAQGKIMKIMRKFEDCEL